MKFYEIKTNIYHIILIESKIENEMVFENAPIVLRKVQPQRQRDRRRERIQCAVH